MADLRREHIVALARQLGDGPVFVMLGTGASVGLAPMYSQVRLSLEAEVSAHGRMFAVGAVPGPELKRIYASPNAAWTAPRPVAMTGPGTLVAMLCRTLWLPDIPMVGNPYRILDLLPNGSCPFNLNVDAIAERTCLSHAVLSPHGTLATVGPIIESLDDAVHRALNFGVDLHAIGPLLRGLLLSRREDSQITARRPEYRLAEIRFASCRAVVIVGYAFGRLGNSIDDVETLAFLAELLRRHPKPVFVVDVAPEHTAGLIDREAPKAPVVPIAARWRPMALTMRRLALHPNPVGLSALHNVPHVVSELYSYVRDLDDELTGTVSPMERALLEITMDRAGDWRSPPTESEWCHLHSAAVGTPE